MSACHETRGRTAGWLSIRYCRTLHGDGNETTQAGIACPFKDHTVGLPDCQACGFLGGLSPDPSGQATSVLCSRRLDELETPAAPAVPRLTLATLESSPFADMRTQIGSVMNREVVCVSPTVSVETVTTLLLEKGLSGVPVVDESGRVIGIVSKTDLLRERFEADGNLETTREPLRVRAASGFWALGSGFHAERVSRATVGEIMTPLAITLPEEEQLSRACAVMAFEGIHRVPVVAADGRVVGLLSTTDVMRWLARGAGYRLPEYTRSQKP